MPNYSNLFMMEWGSWIYGIGMVLFGIFFLVVGFVFLKKLCSHFSKESDQDDNINNSICLILPKASSS